MEDVTGSDVTRRGCGVDDKSLVEDRQGTWTVQQGQLSVAAVDAVDVVGGDCRWESGVAGCGEEGW